MTVELRPEITASPEDLYGTKGRFMGDFAGINRFVRVADHMEEVCSIVSAKGFKVRDFHDEWIVFREGATLAEAELSFFLDRVDRFVWVAEQEVEKFKSLFDEETAEGAVG